MIPSTENEDQQLRLLRKAIKSVYAAVYFASARGYITSTGNVIAEEKMAIVIQEVCGAEENGYFFPTISGVARSINFYPVGHERADEGIVKIAYGLGKVVVDGDQVLRFSPEYPKHTMQTSTPEQTIRETQQSILALSMRAEDFKTSIDEGVNLKRLTIDECEQFASLREIASTYDYENQRIVDSCYPNGPRKITFAPVLKFNTFPLVEIIKELFAIANREMKCPVEIEFAAVMGDSPIFNVLQIRPISTDSLNVQVDWDEIDESNPLILSDNALGVGHIQGVSDVIYLKKDAFDKMQTREMAATLRTWNARLQKEGRGYLLIGYGRWGSQISSLGVPVVWGDISECKALVECNLCDFRVEPSQGSHFFQNLTSFNVGYINVDPFARHADMFDEAQLNALPAVEETTYLRHVRLSEDLQICVDGFKSHALVKIVGNK